MHTYMVHPTVYAYVHHYEMHACMIEPTVYAYVHPILKMHTCMLQFIIFMRCCASRLCALSAR